MNPSIFRQYDIRGIIDQDLTAETSYLIGKAYGSYLRRHQSKTVIVSRDNRPHGEKLKTHLIAGLRETGCDVIDIGVVPTPAAYFAHHELNGDAGIQITGSHNPPEFNGYKLTYRQTSFFAEQIQELKQIILDNDFVNGSTGELFEEKILDRYHDMICNKIKLDRSLKVVIDAGNATGGLIAPRILRSLGCEVHELYCEPDGSFPNHHPDPTVSENLVDLIALTKKMKADVGIAYDGDSDRIGVVNERGDIIWGDQLLALFAREILKEGPAPIIFEVKCSVALIEDIKKHGGEPIMWKTGHSIIKRKMKELNAPLAGEMSGHIFFKHEYYGFDDAIYATTRLLRILSRTQLSLSQLLADLPRYPSTPEIRSDCPDELKFQVVEKLKDEFRNSHQIIDVDGMRIIYDDGIWGLVRASNTQPILVSRYEAKTENRLNEIRREIETKLQQVIRSFA